MEHRAHLYPSVDTGTWLIDVIRDLVPDDDDPELPIEAEDEPVATLDTGVPEAQPAQSSLEIIATLTLKNAGWNVLGDWQPGHGELTAYVQQIDHARLQVWGLWLARTAGAAPQDAVDPAALEERLTAHFAGPRTTEGAMELAAVTMLDEMVADLRDIYDEEHIVAMLADVGRQLQGTSDGELLGAVIGRIVAGDTVESWRQEEHASHPAPVDCLGATASLYGLAVLLSGAVDRASDEVGFAARRFAGSSYSLLSV